MRRVSSLLSACLMLGACVDAAKRRVGEPDTTDTAQPDTTDTAQPDTGAPDAEPGDGTDPDSEPSDVTSPDAADGDTAGPTCSLDEQCPFPGDLAPCNTRRCVEGFCGVGPVDNGSPCDDGNLCTRSDSCQNGACESGPQIDCEELGVCMVPSVDDPVCEPATGCPVTARIPGFPCGETTVPVCDSGWSIPPSACDGQGGCHDYALDVPAGPHPLAGEWYFVATSSGVSGDLDTVRALLSLGTTLGTWSATNVAATSANLEDRLVTDPNLGGSPGTYCAGFAGDIALEHDDSLWFGSVDASKNVMILSGLSQSDLGVAVRKSGNIAGLTGKFIWFGLEKGEAGQGEVSFLTRQGFLQLEGGCVQPGSQVRRAEGLGATLLFDTGSTPCFQPDNGLVRLDVNYTAQDGESVLIPMQLRGVAGMNGDIMLLTRDDGSLQYGTILLVREQAQPSIDLLGRWRFHALRGGIATPGQLDLDPRLDDGWLGLDVSKDLHGELHGADLIANISGWWAAQDQPARYSHRASFGNDLVYHTGHVAKRGTFAVAMSTIAPADIATPSILPMIIGEGGLFLMVRPASFVEGWRDGVPPPLD